MRWLVTGASGTLGSYLIRELIHRERTVCGWSGTTSADVFGATVKPVDLMQRDEVIAEFRVARPDIVIHAGAMARVDECFQLPDRARRINTEGTRQLAELAAITGARLFYVSTDLVFDGEQAPYRESDKPKPLTVYGRSKADAESAVLDLPNGAVARVSLLFGPSILPRRGFFDALVEALKAGRPITLFVDEWRTPLGLADGARALCDLAESGMTGTIHVGGPERMSRFEMGRRLAKILRVSDAALLAGSRNHFPKAEPRPRDVSLDSSHWRSRFLQFPKADFETALTNMLKL